MNPHARSWKMDEHGEIPTKIAYAFFPKLNPHVRWYKAWKKMLVQDWMGMIQWSNQWLWPIPFPKNPISMTHPIPLFQSLDVHMDLFFVYDNGMFIFQKQWEKNDDNNCYMTISWLWTMIITNNNYQMTITLLFNRITIYNNHYEHSSWLLPSGKPTQLWKITMFNGKIHYNWSFSIAMLNYQRV